MIRPWLLRFTLLLAVGLTWTLPGHAASSPSPQRVQTQIAEGHTQAALSELRRILKPHPRSGVAWYLAAEADDAAGHDGPARQALAKAERFAPGLPFANAHRVAALRARLAQGSRPPRHVPILPLVVIGALLLIGLVWLRRVMRLRRQRMGTLYPPGYGSGSVGSYGMRLCPNAGPPPYYGSSVGMAGGWPGMRGRFGSMLSGGLAAGLGVGLGERMIDGIWGNRNAGGFNSPVAGDDMANIQVLERDEELIGSPGWDSSDSNAWGNPDPSDGGGGDLDDDDGLSGGGGW